MRRTVMLATGLALAPVTLSAQPLTVGDRIRVSVSPPATQRIEGTVVRLDRDTLALTTHDGEQSVPIRSVNRLERWYPTNGGVVIGGLIGAGLLGFTQGGVGEAGESSFPWAVAGLLPGAAVGWLVAGRGWRRVSLETLREMP